MLFRSFFVMGWHFSWMGDKSRRLIKRDSFCHYNDKFSYLDWQSYSSDTATNMLSKDASEGMEAYSGKHHRLFPYPHEKLPKEIFEVKKLKDFFLPGYEEPVSVDSIISIETSNTVIYEIQKLHDEILVKQKKIAELLNKLK